jgi:lincosamide nucleotidyltransferase A/C/D/E
VTAPDVLNLYAMTESLGIAVWIDGGWGVDALLGRQTRPHSDLDIAIEHRDVARLRAVLESHGYRDVPRDDTTPWNFVLGDAHGRLIDVHAFVFDERGEVVDGIMYPAASLAGSGTIAGRAVRCISADHLVKFHTGYAIRDTDRADVSALCERFGIELPPEYRRTEPESR